MKKLYGLPYMGSKNRIAEWVVDNLPYAINFYDVFGGGGSVTHCAMLSGKFRNFHMNDLNPICGAFRQFAQGEISDERLNRWISRAEYYECKDNDPVAFFAYSFGGNGENYLYAKEIEPFKKALHESRVFGDPSTLREMGIQTDSRKWLYNNCEKVKQLYTDWYLKTILKTTMRYEDYKTTINNRIKEREAELRNYLLDAFKKSGLKTLRQVGEYIGNNMERHYFGVSQWVFPSEENYNKMREIMPLPLEYAEIYGLGINKDDAVDMRVLLNLAELSAFYSLENMGNVRRLKSLRGLNGAEHLTVTNASYDAIEIAPNSVIYADPPYRDTCSYVVGAFNHDQFYEWCLHQTELVIVSEYYMPEPDFTPVAQIELNCTLSATNNGKKVKERLFVPTKQLAKFRQRAGFLF